MEIKISGKHLELTVYARTEHLGLPCLPARPRMDRNRVVYAVKTSPLAGDAATVIDQRAIFAPATPSWRQG